jgi:hypothetical protein
VKLPAAPVEYPDSREFFAEKPNAEQTKIRIAEATDIKWLANCFWASKPL